MLVLLTIRQVLADAPSSAVSYDELFAIFQHYTTDKPMKTRTTIITLLLAGWVITAQAQLFAPEINVQTMPNNQIELESDLFFTEPSAGPTSYIQADGYAQFNVVDISHRGDNSFMRFKTAIANKRALVGMQDDGDEGLYFLVNSVYRLNVNMNGNVGIGHRDASEKLHVNGNVLASNYNVTSDERLKQNVREYDAGLALVKQINPKKYKYKPRKEQKIKDPDEANEAGKEHGDEVVEEEVLVMDDREYFGVVAQELQAVAPDLVGSFKDAEGSETLTVNQTALTFVLINAVKELSAEVEALRATLKAKEK